jgi:signal transduction histidine kinase
MTAQINRLIILLLCLVAFSVDAHTLSQEPQHYSMHDMEKGVAINGEWDFYWQTTFSQFKQSIPLNPKQVYVPGNWEEAEYPNKGYGLFHSSIIITHGANNILALYVPSVYTSYRLYINDSLYTEVGHFDTTASTAKPDYFPRIITFKTFSDTVNIYVEVSNYAYRIGGLTYELTLGTHEKIASAFINGIIIQSFFSGAFILIGLYFLFVFFFRRKDTVSIYFALLCLSTSCRILFTDLILVRQLGILLSWESLAKIECLSLFLIPTFGTLYLITLLKDFRLVAVVKVFNLITILLCCYVMLLPVYYTSFILPYFRFFAAIQLLFQFYTVGYAALTKRNDLSIVVLVGFILVFFAGLNDILYSSDIVPTFYMLPMAIFSYVLIQAIILIKGWTFAFAEVERLSVELMLTNKNQEKTIGERTMELKLKTQELGHYNGIKDRIFSIIGHDLRAPIATLSTVLSIAEQIENEQELAELPGYLKGIKTSVDNLNLTIENLLVWSQSQINGVTLNIEGVNVNNEIDNVIALYSLVALQKEITLKQTLTGSFCAKVDAAHLNLVLRNIISNSIKFSNKGGSIIVSATMPDPLTVQISISDTGIGLRAEKLEELLKTTDTHYTTYGTQNEKGTGLGLMLCKEYIHANGGELHIESTIDIGTTVTIKLPSA